MYRLGLLQCDVVAEELQPQFKDYPLMFAEAFEQAGISVEWAVFNLLEGQQPNSLNEADGYITTGSRSGVYDPLPWYSTLVELIKKIHDAEIPLVGICFGHQAIADALGGKVENSGKGWGIGINHYRTASKDAGPCWMNPLLEAFNVPVCHQDQVVSLPSDSKVLASSEHCENFVVEFSPTTLGVQGHPEFDTAYVRELITLREGILPTEVALTARASLENAPDNKVILNWIAQFLTIEQR